MRGEERGASAFAPPPFSEIPPGGFPRPEAWAAHRQVDERLRRRTGDDVRGRGLDHFVHSEGSGGGLELLGRGMAGLGERGGPSRGRAHLEDRRQPLPRIIVNALGEPLPRIPDQGHGPQRRPQGTLRHQRESRQQDLGAVENRGGSPPCLDRRSAARGDG